MMDFLWFVTHILHLLILLNSFRHIAPSAHLRPALFHSHLSCATTAASLHDFIPAAANLFRATRRQVSLGLPLLRVPSGAQPRLT